MNNKSFIYFDIKENKEIIKYRKLDEKFVEATDITPSYESVFINTENDIDDYELIIQPIGTLLLDFLNISLDNCYNLKTFAFKYGIDNLLYMDKKNILHTYLTYPVKEFNQLFIEFFESVKNSISRLQLEFKEIIEFCFNDSGDKKINKLNPKQRYFLSFHGCDNGIYYTKQPKFQKYSKGISLDYDSFFNRDIELEQYTNNKLIQAVSSKEFVFAPSFYSCSKIENVLFLSFINLIEITDLHINICANCGKFFIPTSKSNEKYCSYKLNDGSGRTCKDVGADRKYKAKIKDDEINSLIRNISSTLSMRVKRNPDIVEHKTKYDNWKENYPIQIKKFQNNEITKDELINWINDARR